MTSTDNSSSAYIARIQAQNIIASVANGTRGGIGFRGSLLLAKIESILNAPPLLVVNPNILSPIDLSGSVSGNGDVELTWTNRASGIIDTQLEKDIGDGWEIITHPVLGSSNTIAFQFFDNAYFRVSSITSEGVSLPSTALYFESLQG